MPNATIKFIACVLISLGISSCIALSPIGWDRLNLPMHWMLEAFLSAFITILVFIWMNNRSFIIMRLLVCLVASWGVALWAIKMGSAVLTFWFFHVYRKGALEDATITMIRGSEIIVGTIAATSLAFLLDAFRKQKQSSDY